MQPIGRIRYIFLFLILIAINACGSSLNTPAPAVQPPTSIPTDTEINIGNRKQESTISSIQTPEPTTTLTHITPTQVPTTTSPPTQVQPTATPTTITLDQKDIYSVINYLVYLIRNKRPDLISPLIGSGGTSLMQGAYGQEYNPPGRNNETGVIRELGKGLEGASPTCLGMIVYNYEGFQGSAHVFFQGIKCEFADRCGENDVEDSIINFVLKRDGNNIWSLPAITNVLEFSRDSIETEVVNCPDVPLDPNLQPTVIQTSASDSCEYDSDFVADLTIPDDTQIRAGRTFTKTWRLLNSGTCDWTSDYQLIFISGDQMSGPSKMRLNKTARPGETVDLSIELVAPQRPGTYRGQWQLATPDGELFGTKPYVQIVVP